MSPTATILQELKEVDRLLHRLTERLKEETQGQTAHAALRALKGMLKGRLTEDPLAYQRRIRKENDAHRLPEERS